MFFFFTRLLFFSSPCFFSSYEITSKKTRGLPFGKTPDGAHPSAQQPQSEEFFLGKQPKKIKGIVI
jgi:hypothetical protein